MGRSTTNRTTKVVACTAKQASAKLSRESAASRVLGAALALEKAVGRSNTPRKQVVTFACVKPASELCVLSKLKMDGLILYTKDMIQLTDEGRSQADCSTVPRDNRSFHDHLKDKFLTGASELLFEAMTDGRTYDCEFIGELLDDGTDNTTVKEGLATLAELGLIDYPRNASTVRLTNLCFPFGRPE